MTDDTKYLELTADVVAAYAGANTLSSTELVAAIASVHAALRAAAAGHVPAAPVEAPKPAVPVRKSVTPETVYCLECGKGFKSLKRHIGTEHALSPADYRVRWGLPSDYPMVASAYAEQRSELAKRIGLGNSRRIVAESVAEAPVAEETAAETNGKAPRKRKSKDA